MLLYQFFEAQTKNTPKKLLEKQLTHFYATFFIMTTTD